MIRNAAASEVEASSETRGSLTSTELLIVFGCYSSFWSNFHSIGTVLQRAFLVTFFVAASVELVRKRQPWSSLSTSEGVFLCAGVLSSIASMVRGEESSVLYSMTFVVAILEIAVLVRSVSLARLLDLGAIVIAMCLLTCLVFERRSLMTSLSVSIGSHGLYRFSPVGNHPNLTGYIFGAGSILLARVALLAKNSKLKRAFAIVGVVLAWAIILAASARASLLAIGAASAIGFTVESKSIRKGRVVAFASAAALIGLAVELVKGNVFSYISRILELESNTRGVGSGASGRTYNWAMGIGTLVNDPGRLFFGAGLRSSDLLPFTTEDSYITILLDSGIFLGAALIGVFVLSFLRAVKLSKLKHVPSECVLLLPTLIAFLLIESIFNRYLLAIGNPISLFSLIFVVALTSREVKTA